MPKILSRYHYMQQNMGTRNVHVDSLIVIRVRDRNFEDYGQT